MCPFCPFDENNVEIKVNLCTNYNLSKNENEKNSKISNSDKYKKEKKRRKIHPQKIMNQVQVT